VARKRYLLDAQGLELGARLLEALLVLRLLGQASDAHRPSSVRHLSP
jgi:hypothetical protein